MDPGDVALPAAFRPSRRAYDRLAAGAADAPAPARDAATVLLVRDGTRGPEVFVQHRVAEMAFAAGMTVFPGGGVDARDRRPDDDRALRRCAIRELFEETGVLLAGPSAGETVDDTAALASSRTALAAHEADLATVLADAGLVPRDDLLVPWARWITPELVPRRYDTWFFLTAVPPGQEPDGATSEAADAGWATPGDVLTAWRAGDRKLMPPTWAVLGQLAEARDVASLVGGGGRHLEPVIPRHVLVDDRVELVIPRAAVSAAALQEAS